MGEAMNEMCQTFEDFCEFYMCTEIEKLECLKFLCEYRLRKAYVAKGKKGTKDD